MLSDEELIDQLRSELGSLTAPADLIERLREQAAANRHGGHARLRDRRGHHRRRLRLPVGFLAVAASSLFAIGIAAGALLLLSHRGPSRAAATGKSQPGARERVPTLAELKAEFAVLRRPQTAADRSARTLCPHPCQERLLPGLTRVARTLPDGSRVFLSVWRLRVAALQEPAGSYVLREVVIPKRREAILDPTSIPETPFVVGGTLAGIPSAGVSPSTPLWTAVLPDGVGSVRWTFVCTRGKSCRQRALSPVTVNLTVIDNIAAARIPGTGYGLRGAGFATWYAGDGRQVASFSSPARQTTPFPPANLNALLISRPRERLLLTGVSLGAVSFGASPARLQRLFDPLLGHPNGGYQSVSDCGVDHVLIWPIVLNPATGLLERSEELELFFHHHRFVGYHYGGIAVATRDGGRRLRLHATTTRGLAIGDPLSVGQRLYGRAFQVSSAQGGTWQAQTAQGTIRGYALGHPKHGDVSPSSLIASIDAGDVGCPALSP